MSRRTTVIPILLALLALLLISCDGGTTCPPISGPVVATVPGASDASSVEIADGTNAEDDSSGGPWCDTGSLTIDAVDVDSLIGMYGCFYSRSTTTDCYPDTALAAVDVAPSNVSFPNPPEPLLRYDLVAHPPKNQDATYFAIYQLKSTVPTPPALAWKHVGDASLVPGDLAEGNINHFSIFALVELPTPSPLSPPLRTVMVVASDFIEDSQGSITVDLTTQEIDAEEILVEVGETRIFRFSNIDPAYDDPKLPTDCLALDLIEDQLTCLFPEGTKLEITLGVDGTENLISIFAPDRGYEARLHANLEIY